jgi:hypothetical protein
MGAHGSLQLDDDLAFQHADWRGKRVGRIALAALLLAAALGLLGYRGPLSRGLARDAAGRMMLEYARCVTADTSTTLILRVVAEPPMDEFALLAGGSLLTDAELEHVAPAPTTVLSTPAGVLYRFRIQPGAGVHTVRIMLRYTHWGWRTTTLGPPGEPGLSFGQFVFP